MRKRDFYKSNFRGYGARWGASPFQALRIRFETGRNHPGPLGCADTRPRNCRALPRGRRLSVAARSIPNCERSFRLLVERIPGFLTDKPNFLALAGGLRTSRKGDTGAESAPKCFRSRALVWEAGGRFRAPSGSF
jgi:hypothetical protein